MWTITICSIYWESPCDTIVNHFMRSAQFFLICLFLFAMLGSWSDQQEKVLFFSLYLFFLKAQLMPAGYTQKQNSLMMLRLYFVTRMIKKVFIYSLILYYNCYCSVLTSLPFFTIPTYGKANRKIVWTPVSNTHIFQHILEHFTLP